jgi:hypothetical protein
VQSQEQYKDKTTFILATDHGRGISPKKEWKSHGTKIEHSDETWMAVSDETWMAVIGPDSKALGEIKSESQCYTNQLAKTAAALLGLDYTNDKEVGQVIESIIK